jgi:hypothetical protein
MTNLTISDDIVTRLQRIASEENRPVEAVLRSLLELYTALPKVDETPFTTLSSEAALAAMDGMLDEDVTDLSATVRETMDAYYRKKYGNPD